VIGSLAIGPTLMDWFDPIQCTCAQDMLNRLIFTIDQLHNMCINFFTMKWFRFYKPAESSDYWNCQIERNFCTNTCSCVNQLL